MDMPHRFLAGASDKPGNTGLFPDRLSSGDAPRPRLNEWILSGLKFAFRPSQGLLMALA